MAKKLKFFYYSEISGYGLILIWIYELFSYSAPNLPMAIRTAARKKCRRFSAVIFD